MKTNIKKYFSLNKADARFSALTDEEKLLVEAGFEVVKQYIAKKAQKSERKSFAELLSDVKIDGENDNDLIVEKMVKYSLEKAGVDVSNFELKDIANPMLHNKVVFKETFNNILSQIITPIIPAMISAEFMDFADIANIGWGDTARFQVKSNDIYYVTRIAEGVLNGSVQRVYNDELTVNPEPYNIKTTVDWYQVAAGIFDLGEFVYRIGISFSAYVTQMVIDAITNYITANASTSYVVNGFSTLTFARLAEILRAANGGARVRAYGTLAALSTIIPEASAYTGLREGLGEEWSKVGYIGVYKDVDLMRIPQILLPNTVNTTPLVGIPDTTVYLMADGGHKPVKLVFEGSAITIDIIPTESPDKEMGISVTHRMGMTFVAASKMGAVTGLN